MDIEYASNVDSDALKTVTFDGTANTGAVGDVPLFTVTGDILVVTLVPICTTLLTEGGATAELELGVTTNTTLFIAQTQPIDIDANEIWQDATPTASSEALVAALQNIVVIGGADDILATVVNDTVDTGVINFYLRWRPLSSDGLVVPA
jgi:hypothetical protein